MAVVKRILGEFGGGLVGWVEGDDIPSDQVSKTTIQKPKSIRQCNLVLPSLTRHRGPNRTPLIGRSGTGGQPQPVIDFLSELGSRDLLLKNQIIISEIIFSTQVRATGA
jgi:hypothetical protein